MPNKRIQDLPKVDQLTSGDIFPLGRASASYDAYGVTGQQLADFIKAEAQTFVDAAEKSATDAESSKIAAAQSVTQANAAKDAADLAKTGAETAKSGAESAQAAAEESRQAIENMTVSAQEVGSDEPVAVQKTIVEGVVNLLFSLKAGPTGQQGPKGNPGSSIQKIERTSGTGAPGTTDTYTITLTDGSTSTFTVYNGANGEGAGDMVAAIYDPNGKSTDIYKYVDDKIAAIPTPDVSGQIEEHNTSSDAHQDIRSAIPTTAEDVGADPSGSASKALSDSKSYTDSKIAEIQKPDLSGKVDKVSSATSGNIAILTSDGGIQDSGKSLDNLGNNDFVVTFSGEVSGPFTADKTFAEIFEAYNSGSKIYAKYSVESTLITNINLRIYISGATNKFVFTGSFFGYNVGLIEFSVNDSDEVTGDVMLSHTHKPSEITDLAGTDYTTSRVRGIALMTSVPGTIPNGCIVGVYE